MSDTLPESEAAPAAEPAVAPQTQTADQLSTDPVESMKCPKCGALVDVRGLEAFTRIQCPSCSAEISVPARFGHFLLLRRLGSGGMGTAFLAEDEALGRKVAVKVMQKSLGADEKAFETFKNEAQSAARLNHPHVAQVYSFGQEKGNPYLEMELVPGGDLGSFISEGTQLDPAFVMRVGMEIAEGLKAAEEVGLFHGDVKPDNILFDENASAKLVDFGIASRSSQGKSDELWGTPYYIAPEKVQKKMNSARSDIYSLGATLYHAITGQPPYEGADAVEVIKARFDHPPTPIETLRPDVEPEVARIVMRMMYKDLFQRYPNYNSLLGDMKKYLEGVSPIRKQGPKGASRRAAGLTGTLRPEASGGASETPGRSGKKKFVITKGQIEAAEARKEMEEASGRRAAESGKMRIRARGSAAPSGTLIPEGQEEADGASGQKAEKSSSGGGRGLLFALLGTVGLVFLSVVCLGVWYFAIKIPRDKRMTVMAYEECKSNEARYLELREELVKLGAKADAEDARIAPLAEEVDKLVYEAVREHFSMPDIEPAEVPEESVPDVGPTVTAAEALSAAPAPGEAAAAPAPEAAAPAPRKPRETAVDAYARYRHETMGYGQPAEFKDMIVSEAAGAGMSPEEYAREKLAEKGVPFEGGGGESQPEAAPADAAVAADAPEPVVEEAPPSGIPADLADIIDKEFVSRARTARAEIRACQGVVRRITSADSPLEQLSKAPTIKEYQRVAASRKTVCDKLEQEIEGVRARLANADRALKEMALLVKPPKQGRVKTTIHTVAMRHRDARLAAEKAAAEEEARKQAAEEAAAAAREAAEIAAEEVARVQDSAMRQQSLIDAFQYETFIERMGRMANGELTTEEGRRELQTVIDRAQRCIDLREFVFKDLERGEVRQGFLNRYDIRGISRDHSAIQVRSRPDVPVSELGLRHWIWLCYHLIENRPADRRGVSDYALSDQMINAAVFFHLHGKGEYGPMERSRKLARRALVHRSALRDEVIRLLPFMAEDDPSAEGEGAQE